MAPKAPKKTNPEVPPPPPAAIDDIEMSHSLPIQVLFHFNLIYFIDLLLHSL